MPDSLFFIILQLYLTSCVPPVIEPNLHCVLIRNARAVLDLSVSLAKTSPVISKLHLEMCLFVPVFDFVTVKGKNEA